MLRILSAVPKITVTALIILAIVNLLIGVFLRYFVGAITDWLDVDPVPFTWVEEVGEMSLAWLTLIGAAIGVQSRSHFTLAVFVHRLPLAAQLWIHRFNHALIAGVGVLAAWYGFKLCLLNRTLTTPGLRDQSRLALRLRRGRRHPDRRLRARDDDRAAAARRAPALTGMIHAACDRRHRLRRADRCSRCRSCSRSASPASRACGSAATRMQQLSSALVSGSQSWVLLAIPAFVFAGNLMERCGMSHALVELARALVGWVKGGLGMSVIVVAYFFSDICGSKMAEVSALGSTLMPPLTKAGYDRRDSASLIAAGTAMGMLVPPAIFMIVIAQVTNTSAVALFLAGFVPAVVIMLCLMVAGLYPRPPERLAGRCAAEPEAPRPRGAARRGADGDAVRDPRRLHPRHHHRDRGRRRGRGLRLPRRQASTTATSRWREMGKIAYDSAILTAAVVFLLAVASVFQYLMGVSGRAASCWAEVLGPLKTHPWLFLIGTALMTCCSAWCWRACRPRWC